MKLLILGSTGPTGQQLVKQAVDGGHSVKVLVRNPEKFAALGFEKSGDKAVEVISGSVYEAADMRNAMTGCDAVLSSLGGKPSLGGSCDIYSKPCDVAMEVMNELGIKRFVTVTAWGTKDDPRLPFVWRRVLKPTLMKKVVVDMDTMEEKLVGLGQDSSIVWTVVKPPRLTNDPLTGLTPLANEGQLVNDWTQNMLCRADLAKFMLDCLDTTDWDNKLVAVCVGKKA